MSQVKINKLEIENVKRVKAVKIEPSQNGLTIIGGDNGEGKTSVLDSIAWGLGGGKFKPSQPHREGSMTPPYLHIVLSNGLVVERKGKNSDLKVIDPDGNRSGQDLLNSFVEELALDLPKFMQGNNKAKADTLLKIIGVGEELAKLEQEETDIYNRRHAIGQIADQKAKFAREQEYYPDAPKDLVSASELIKEQQEILAKNGENQRKREKAAELAKKRDELSARLDELKAEFEKTESLLTETINDCVIAAKDADTLIDESTEELEQNIREIDEINRKVRANLDKDKAEEDALQYKRQYDTLTQELTDVREKKQELLNHADLPLPALSVEDGELTYQGHKWDCMSSSEQLKVATAITRKLKPSCGFVLLDKLEQMDLTTLTEFGAWLEAEGLQAIATRVSTGEECSIIIEDGYVKDTENAIANAIAESQASGEENWDF